MKYVNNKISVVYNDHYGDKWANGFNTAPQYMRIKYYLIGKIAEQTCARFMYIIKDNVIGISDSRG